MTGGLTLGRVVMTDFYCKTSGVIMIYIQTFEGILSACE